MNMEFFERRGIIPALLYYIEHDGEGVQKSDYAEMGISINTQIRVHKDLFDTGLIEVMQNRDRHLFQLTQTGRTIANHFKEIRDLVNTEHHL